MKIRPNTSRDITVIETSQESNKSKKSLENVSVQNLSNTPRKDNDLITEFDCVNHEQVQMLNKDYKRESLDLFEGSFEHTKYSITVNVTQNNNLDNHSNQSISDSYLVDLMNIKTPIDPDVKWDCNIGGESILELTQRDFEPNKRKREEDSQTEKHNLHDKFLEPPQKYKKIEDPSTSYSKPTDSCDLFEGTMFPESMRINTQLDKLLNSNVCNSKLNMTLNTMSSAGMSESVMQQAFQNSFDSMSNTIVCPKKCDVVDMTCKDLIISDSEDMIAGSQDTTSSGPSPRKYIFIFIIFILRIIMYSINILENHHLNQIQMPIQLNLIHGLIKQKYWKV